MSTTATTKRFVYYGGGTEDALIEKSGQEVEVLRELGDEDRDEEAGRMFRVRFQDGSEHDAFEEELEDVVASASAPANVMDSATRREGNRRVEYVWEVGKKSHDEEVVAVLTISHTKAGINYFNGERTTEDYFGVVLRNETRSYSNGFSSRSFMVGSGIGLFRIAAGNRYSAKRLREAEAEAVKRFAEVYEAGTSAKVARIFRGEDL